MKPSAPRITMRVNILSIFMALVLVSFTAVLFFLRSKNNEIVSGLSQEMMASVRKNTNRYLNDLFEATERLDAMIVSLYRSPEEINPENEQLRSFMLSAVKSYPNIAYLYIGTEKGDFFTAGDLSFSTQKNYFSKPEAPLPEKAAFLWQEILLSRGEPIEISYYLDEDLNILDSEAYPQLNYDPRLRPWYIGAKQAKNLFWTPVYHFFETESLGITASEPLTDSSGNIFGIAGVDLSFDLLSKFLSAQTVGKSGKIFILNSKGHLIVPEEKPEYFSSIPLGVVSAAFRTYQEKHAEEFKFKWEGVRYLCSLEPLPIKNGEDWLIAIIVPHGDFFAKLELTQKSAIFIVLVILALASLAVIFLASRLSKPIVLLAREVDKVRHLDFSGEERVHSIVKEIYLMDLAISQMRAAVQSFIRYVPKEIVQGLFSQNREIKLGGEKKEVTVFFSDIEGFTSITEEQPTEALMTLLGEYFDEMSKIILAAEGTIDKYIGDSVMAFWGAPKPSPRQAAVCAETVLRCHAFVQAFNRRCAEKNLPLFRTRFGINSGVAIVGNIGTPERMNYTLIGDMVNAAARIQVTNKVYGTSILMGEAVKKQLDERFLSRPIDLVEVKGKKMKIALFELMAMRGGAPEIAPTPELLDLALRFTKAYEAMLADQRGEAKQLFEAISRDFPDDLPTTLYLERLQ